MRSIRLSAFIVALLITPKLLKATTVVPLTFEQLVQTAREVFVGEVIGRESRWTNTEAGRTIVTLVTFRVDESLKGNTPTRTTLEFLGGTVGETTLSVDDMPAFSTGDRDVLFVANRNGVSPLVGLMQGRFRINIDAGQSGEVVRTHNGRSIQSITPAERFDAFPLRITSTVTLSNFKTAVLTLVESQRRQP